MSNIQVEFATSYERGFDMLSNEPFERWLSPVAPRKGDEVEIDGKNYDVQKVIWRREGAERATIFARCLVRRGPPR